VRVLVTGDRGHVGAAVAGLLRSCGNEVGGFDRAAGADVLDLAAVRGAARGCAAIVHLAALAHDGADSPEQIMAVNVLGNWHVLLATEAAGDDRVIYFSAPRCSASPRVSVFLITFPVDDGHPPQGALWRGGHIRAVGLFDLLIAAAAERARVTVLHYDGDYEVIAQITGQPVQ
jgi:UDP-glucose 4-epimerase